MKKLIKILPILMTVMMVFMAVSPVLADSDFKPSDVKITREGSDQVQNIGGTVLGIIQVIGNIAAVGILMVVGIRYMMGSAQEKAEYKKVMIPYIIGAILVFAASNLATIIYNFANANFQ